MPGTCVINTIVRFPNQIGLNSRLDFCLARAALTSSELRAGYGPTESYYGSVAGLGETRVRAATWIPVNFQASSNMPTAEIDMEFHHIHAYGAPTNPATKPNPRDSASHACFCS